MGSRSRGARGRNILIVGVTGILLFAVVYGGVGAQLFVRDHQDALRPVDAVVVLGGEHDGREDYGLRLAQQGYARTVVISDPSGGQSPVMRRACAAGTADIEVLCFDPDPPTTRGEAMQVQRLANERQWQSVIVISWRFHLVRARYIFGQCFDGQTVMRSVPRDYDANPLTWTFRIGYQYAGFAKAAALGC